ncbi:heme ABC exporter ATP-binding protein CcmA [Wenzhouxiangella marina]|uniref:Cytochrome C biogenesis protein CcmA n=1 Tax=Wenzhouxiangella marina TaxID=1579979 RepID=A0A0K0XY13_9GAMM|nr:heme ABC exporter ATP-binding protein CcmA [Wenzhouxiangella marina]AKS42501.1 cytochrome C biogenesis protein CcmA [Wenzhouxiangella marina]MBB6085723.1 heme exporter protein A [Wenzhouxiangella marina]
MPSEPSDHAACLLEADGLRFERHGEAIFQDVGLRMRAGGLLLILGPNGSGKTTLLRCLAGVIRPVRGTLHSDARRAFLGHRTGLKADLSCRENLEFIRRFHGPTGLDPNRALARVGLAGFGLRLARTLSAGQGRRLGLASLLVAHRPIWLLDEPYASLDDAGGQLVDELIAAHLEDGGSVALSTHQRMPALHAQARTLRLDTPRGDGS